MLSDATIEEFKKSLRGELIARNDPRYEEARKLYNGAVQRVTSKHSTRIS